MYNNIEKRNVRRNKRALRVRRQVRGTAERPRLSVLRTNKHLSAQLIDDEARVTIASFGTLSKEVKGSEHGKKCKAAARLIGEKLAKQASEKNVLKAVFDRGSLKYHGLIAEIADGARSAGLQL